MRQPKPAAFSWAHGSDPNQSQGHCLGQRLPVEKEPIPQGIVAHLSTPTD